MDSLTSRLWELWKTAQSGKPVKLRFLYRCADGREGIYSGTMDSHNVKCVVDTIKSEGNRFGQVYFTLVNTDCNGFSVKPWRKFSAIGILSDIRVVQ